MSRFDQAVVSYAGWVVRNRWWVVVASVLAVAAMTAGVRFLQFDTDFRAYFGPENPQLQAFDEMQKVYSKADSTFFVLAPKSGDVFQPRVLDAVRKLTAEAWKLPFATRVESITNFQDVEAQGDDLSVAPLLPDDAPITPERIAKIKAVVMKEPALLRRGIATDGRAVGINAVTQLTEASNQEVPQTVIAARALRDRILAEYPEVDIYLTGANPMSYAFTEASIKDMATLVPAMYGVSFLIMFLMLRSAFAVLATLAVVFFASMAAMGIAGYLGIGLTPPVVAAPQIITILAIADSVHVCLTMFMLMREGLDKRAAVIESMRLNFGPVFLTSATTSVCFLGTNFTDSPPLTALGNISSMGGMIAWVLAMILLPALLAILPARVPKERRPSVIPALMERHGEFVIRHRRAVLWATLAVVVGLTLLAPLNEANDDFPKYFGENIQFRRDTDFMVKRLSGFYYIDFSLKSGESNGIASPGYLHVLEDFEQWWRTGPYAAKTVNVVSFSDVVKKLNRAMHGDDPSFYRVPDDRELAAQYLLMYEMSLPFGLDLNNQINIDKSSTRFVVILTDVRSREVREAEQAAHAWLHDHGMEAHGSGPPLMFAYISERNIRSNFLSLPLCVAAISLLLIPGLRSWRLGLLSLVPNLLPLGMAFGIWALISGEIIFTMAVVLNMVVGIIVDDTIHFLTKYLRGRRVLGYSPEDAIRHAFREASSAMIVTTLILGSGFLVLAQSAFLPNSSMAQLTAIAIVIAWPVDLLLLPLLILLVDREPRRERNLQEMADATAHATR